MPAGVTDLLVVHQARGECEESECDAGAQALGRAAAVGFEGELAFAGPEHRFDPLTDGAERSVAVRFASAVGAQQTRAETVDDLFELFAGEALVGENGVAVQRDAPEHLGGDDPLTDVGGGQLKGDRHAVGCAQQVEPKAPEVAAVRRAPAIAGLLGQIPEQVSQAPARERQELAVVGDREKHLRDGQRDELGVGDLRTARPLPRGQEIEIVNTHVKCDDEGVAVGVQEASTVDVAMRNASFGALVMSACANTPPSNMESTI